MPRIFNHIARVREANTSIVNNRLAMGDFMGSPSYRAIQHKGDVRGVKGRGENVRKMVMEIGGIGSFNASLVIPQMFLMARTTDPDAQATILTVEGVQRAINRVGGHVDVNGLLTPETVQALRKVSGASWMSKTWLQIYGDFGDMIARRMSIAPASPGGMAVGDSFTAVPAAVLAGGVVLLLLVLK
jgi:hypothetical protein